MNISIFFISLFVSFSYLFDTDDSFLYNTEKTIKIEDEKLENAKKVVRKTQKTVNTSPLPRHSRQGALDAEKFY